jgi:hypothetical protein
VGLGPHGREAEKVRAFGPKTGRERFSFSFSLFSKLFSKQF